MSIHTIKDLKNHLSLGKFSPVYFIFGEESFLCEQSLKLLLQKIIPEHKDFNYDVFDCENANVHLIREAIETLPVFCKYRLVLCRSAHHLREKDFSFLSPIIENPIETTVLVFSASQWDKRKKFSKLIMQHSFTVENKQPSAKDLIQWVKWIGSLQKLKLSQGSIDLLIQLAGPSLMNINNELIKIKSFITPRCQVETDDIFQISARVRPENIFSFAEAIGKQDVQKSFHYLIHLLEDQQNELGLLALVARHIRILSQVKQGMKEGLSRSKMSSQTGVPVFFLKNYIQQARLWNERKIGQVTEILHATDKALKSSPLSSDIWLENFVFKACSL